LLSPPQLLAQEEEEEEELDYGDGLGDIDAAEAEAPPAGGEAAEPPPAQQPQQQQAVGHTPKYAPKLVPRLPDGAAAKPAAGEAPQAAAEAQQAREGEQQQQAGTAAAGKRKRRGGGKRKRRGGTVGAASDGDVLGVPEDAVAAAGEDGAQLYPNLVALGLERPLRGDLASCFAVGGGRGPASRLVLVRSCRLQGPAGSVKRPHTPLRPSPQCLLRRFKAFEATRVLHAAAGPLADGSVAPQLLPPKAFAARLRAATVALADLASLVLLPAEGELAAPRRERRLDPSYPLPPSPGAAPDGLGLPGRADPCVLQLLSGFRAAELAAALVHASALQLRAARHAASAPAPRDGDGGGGEDNGGGGGSSGGGGRGSGGGGDAATLALLRGLHRRLLVVLRALLGALLAAPGGWDYVRAAAAPLAALADALAPPPAALAAAAATPFAAARAGGDGEPLLGPPLNGVSAVAGGEGADALRRSLAAALAARGQPAGPTPSEALAAALRRAVLLAAAAGGVAAAAGVPAPAPTADAAGAVPSQDAAPLGGGSGVLTLVQALGWEPARGAALSALASCPGALRALLALARRRQVVERAAGRDDAPELADLNGGDAVAGAGGCAFESLYAAPLLLEVLRSGAPGAALGWLPLATAIARVVSAELDRVGTCRSREEARYKAALGQVGGWGEGRIGSRGLPGTRDADAAPFRRAPGKPPPCPPAARRPAQAKGICNAAFAFIARGPTELLAKLDDGLPRLAPPEGAAPEAGAAPRVFDAQAALDLLLAPERYGTVLGALHLLRLHLQAPGALLDAATAASGRPRLAWRRAEPAPPGAPGSGAGVGGGPALPAHPDPDNLGSPDDGAALHVVERALRAAAVALRASAGDAAWAARGGDAIDEVARLRDRRAAAALAASAAAAAAQLLLALSGGGALPRGACVGLAEALAGAHAEVALSQEGVAAALGGAPAGAAGADLLAARHALAACLALWTRNGWAPGVLLTAAGVPHAWSPAAQRLSISPDLAEAGVAPPLPPPPAASPADMLALLLALGDACPAEWPPPGASQHAAAAARAAGARHRAAAAPAAAAGRPPPPPPALPPPFPPPPQAQLRLAIASALEADLLRLPLERAVAFAAASDVRALRCALARLCARASGLGGGMAPYLANLVGLGAFGGGCWEERRRVGVSACWHKGSRVGS
jgi:hypothetical protein